MNHQERMELLGALSRAGVAHYKSHDLEISFGAQVPTVDKQPLAAAKQELGQPDPNPEATEKLKGLIDTLKLDDASLVDRIFPAGAGL